MRQDLKELAQTIINRKNHFIILHGNVYDHVPFLGKKFVDVVDFITNNDSSKVAFPWCITYDIFSGVSVLRGNQKDILSLMGFKPEEKQKGTNAELIKALKEARGETDKQFPLEPEKIFPCFDMLLKKAESIKINGQTPKILLVIDYVDSLIPAGQQNSRLLERMLTVGLTKWAKSPQIREAGHVVILVARQATNLDDTILDRIFESVQIRVPKPDEQERTEFFEKSKIGNAIYFSKATAGLALKDLQNIQLKDDLDETLNGIFDLKQKILKEEYSDVLEVMKPRFGFEAIGGLEHLVKEFKFITKAMREGNNALTPMGVLMMGPPGTGKTAICEALAKDAGVNFVKPVDLKSMWVGESERRATKFYSALKDLAPVIVWIDEIDQYQKQRDGFDGDSGVSSGLFKKMLEFMSDTELRGKILFMFATNRPDLLDSAFKRDGRCDLRVALLPPDINQLALICKSAFRQYPEMRSDITDWKEYLGVCEGYNGANMVEIVRRAWVYCCKNGRNNIIDKDMKWAIQDYIPQRADQKDIAKMALISIESCSSNSLLPENWKDLQKQYQEAMKKEKK